MEMTGSANGIAPANINGEWSMISDGLNRRQIIAYRAPYFRPLLRLTFFQ